jgi:hypothetical protein
MQIGMPSSGTSTSNANSLGLPAIRLSRWTGMKGGSSNAARSRFWKREMQHLANETGLCITMCHFPPGTRKWNKIEHRFFSSISLNWRAKPLISLEMVIELISHTTTQQGLVVTALKDSNTYPTGIKVSDEELEALHIIRDEFHGEPNIDESETLFRLDKKDTARSVRSRQSHQICSQRSINSPTLE